MLTDRLKYKIIITIDLNKYINKTVNMYSAPFINSSTVTSPPSLFFFHRVHKDLLDPQGPLEPEEWR